MTSPPGGSPDTSEPGATGPDPDPRPGRHRAAFIAAGVFALVTAVTWVWMLFIYDPGLLIDELPDPTFGAEAEDVCSAANTVISGLPPAEATGDPIERAGVIDDANATLSAMLGQLRALVPSEPPESNEAINEWLDDWATHLDDRRDYADKLRVDPTARFTETPKASKQISRAIDSFAQVNRMPSCETPGDV